LTEFIPGLTSPIVQLKPCCLNSLLPRKAALTERSAEPLQHPLQGC
jgi:hypothetical protein